MAPTVLFQETYHKESYEHLAPHRPQEQLLLPHRGYGPAMEGGLTTWAWGLLFGLELYRYEFAGLLMHAEHLEAVHGVGPTPSACPA